MQGAVPVIKNLRPARNEVFKLLYLIVIITIRIINWHFKMASKLLV